MPLENERRTASWNTHHMTQRTTKRPRQSCQIPWPTNVYQHSNGTTLSSFSDILVNIVTCSSKRFKSVVKSPCQVSFGLEWEQSILTTSKGRCGDTDVVLNNTVLLDFDEDSFQHCQRVEMSGKRQLFLDTGFRQNYLPKPVSYS